MLPAKFVERVLRELGPDEGGALCRALTGEPSVSVRLNAAKGLAAPSGRPIGWSSGGYWLDARPSFTLDPDFHAGRYYVQEASSQFVGHIVAACGGIGGGRVLDLCAERQRGILREAWRALRSGGLLLYSTCTFNFTENEGVLRDFSAWAAGETEPAERIAVDPAWGVVCGAEGDFQTFRFYPHRVEGEGFFAAAVRKRAAGGERRRVPRPQRDPLAWADRRAVQELERWVEEPEAMRFAVVGDTFYGYWQPQTEAVAMLSGVLNVIASGVEMGQLFKGVLRPAHALALFTGLRRGAAAVCELSPEEALRYLRRGEVAADRFAEGMNLVTADGAALGFAKRIGRRCNNLYPNSLRILKG